MKISPLPSSANSIGAIGSDPGAPRVQPRSLKMNTNATPGREEAQVTPPPALEGVATPEKLSISDKGDPAAEEATQPLSPQFAALAKQRRALQVKEREIADREKALEARAGSPEAALDLARLKSDPLGVLSEAGVTYDQLTEAILASQNGSHQEVQALRKELQALKAGVDKTLTDRDAAAEREVLAEMQKEATRIAAEAGEEFELVRETGSIPTVIKLIERTYRDTLKETGVGEVLDVREAMQLVENELIEESLKVARLQKVQGKLAPTAPPQQQQRPPMRTLTNRDTAQVPMSRKARALAAFYGTLQK